MVNSSLISAWSIFIALVGVSLNALVTTPYTRVSYLGKRDKIKKHKLKERLGKFANILVIIGMLGQLVSIIIL